jgi:hypothetical protein
MAHQRSLYPVGYEAENPENGILCDSTLSECIHKLHAIGNQPVRVGQIELW